MYRSEDLGFSLKPPAWLRNLVGTAVQDLHVAVPTPAGTVNLTPAQIAAYASGARVSFTVPKPGPQLGPVERAAGFVESIPGGWITVAAVVVGGYLLLKRRG